MHIYIYIYYNITHIYPTLLFSKLKKLKRNSLKKHKRNVLSRSSRFFKTHQAVRRLGRLDRAASWSPPVTKLFFLFSNIRLLIKSTPPAVHSSPIFLSVVVTLKPPYFLLLSRENICESSSNPLVYYCLMHIIILLSFILEIKKAQKKFLKKKAQKTAAPISSRICRRWPVCFDPTVLCVR